jgi:nucleoid DNA-binding protein
MQKIPFHIAYLLTKHECVIIPGFGAFVASGIEETRTEKTDILCPPAQFLGFNPDIRHNDGLLANSLAKGSTIPYKEACLQIHQYVAYLNERLENQHDIQIPWVGKVELSAEQKPVFTPSFYLSCNANHFGLSKFCLPALNEIEELDENTVLKMKNEKDVVYIPVNRQFIRWIGSAAAAVLALFLVSTPLTDQSLEYYPQAASLISLPKKEAPAPVVKEDVVKEAQPEVAIPADSRMYYIVIASLPTDNSAKKQLDSYQETGFSTAGIVSAENRHRIYVDKFADKKEAEQFLAKFRTEYPKHQDAWLLRQ